MTVANIAAEEAPAPRLRVIRGGATVDLAGAERAVAALLEALGQDPTDEHNSRTRRGGSRPCTRSC